jgi:transcriptional regulator with XRE-family HTH domain
MAMLHRKVSTIDIQVGSRIRAARLANRVSQQKLGRAIGVKAPQIHKYECGTNRVAPGRLHEIANYLGVAASYFFEDLGSPPATPIRSVDPVTSVLTSKEG